MNIVAINNFNMHSCTVIIACYFLLFLCLPAEKHTSCVTHRLANPNQCQSRQGSQTNANCTVNSQSYPLTQLYCDTTHLNNLPCTII